MPILKRETSLFPATLLDDWPAGSAGRRWWALVTRPRQEKCVARRLLEQAVPFYLPLVVRRNARRGRLQVSHLPLFAGYVFVHGSDDERLRCLATNRLARVLPVYDEPRLVDDLRRLVRLISSGATLACEARLLPGRRVRVASGALVGIEGTVLRRVHETRLFVAIDFLQQGVSLDIDDSSLEPVD